jgi:hypothetical protein
MEKFNPFNDWFFKTKLEVSEQEKEQIKVLLKGINSCFKIKKTNHLHHIHNPISLIFLL